MKKPIISCYVKEVSLWVGQKVKFVYELFACGVGTLAKGSVGFVRNVFKKKSCGASPLNGEYYDKRYLEIKRESEDIISGQFWLNNRTV